MDSLYALGVVFSVMDKFTGPVKSMAETLTKFEGNIKKAQGMVDFGNKVAVSGVMVQGAADKMKGGLLSVLEPTSANQTALGELASLGIKDLQAISNEATKFSKNWSGTTEDQFISAAYDIKSGIASLNDEAVGQFTSMAALTGKATKATTAEMTSMFATGYGIYKDFYSDLSDFQFGQMFSAGIASSVQLFKTTGSGMSQALTTLGAAATTARRPFEEQLAVLGMLQATMPGGEAGTKYKAFVQNAAKAGTSLGLSFVDSNNQLLGMTKILEMLRGKYGDTLDAMEKQKIQQAFGSEEAVALIDLFYGKVGNLKGNIDSLGGAMNKGTAFTEEMARAMDSGVGQEMDLMAQNIRILKREVGDEFAPLVKSFIPVVKGWVDSFQGMAKNHPTLVRTALLLAAIGVVSLSILAPILLIGSGLMMMAGYVIWGFQKIGQTILWTYGGLIKFGKIANTAFNLLRLGALRAGPALYSLFIRLLVLSVGGAAKAYLAMRSLVTGLAQLSLAAIRTAVTALPGLIGAVWSFTAALLANPITWIILAIVALGAVIYLLWRNWDKVTAYIGLAWDWLLGKFDAAVEWIRGAFGRILAAGQQFVPYLLAALFPVVGIPLMIARNWDFLVQYIPQVITNIIAGIKAKFVEFWASGQALITTFTDGIRSVINQPAELVKEGLQKVRNLLPFSDAREGPLSSLTRSGRALVETFASGVAARAPLLRDVAEETLAGAGLSGDGSGHLSASPRVNLHQFVRESIRESSREHIQERRPVVVILKSDQVNADDTNSLVDIALRQLAMSS